MSKLNDLIAELCPNGVEQKHLWEVTIWNKRFNAVNKIKQPKILSYPNILTSELFSLECPNGNVCLLSAGEYIGWTTEDLAGDNLCEGEIIAIPYTVFAKSGQAATIKNTIKYYNGKFVTSENNIVTSFDTTVLLNKYLYYWLINCADMIYTLYNGPRIKHPNMNHILDLKIPLPPLPIQEYIVDILDNFTMLISDINAEINLRRQQYNYYRNILFTFDENISWYNLSEILKIKYGKDYSTFNTGNIPVYGSGGIIAYIDTFIYDKPSVLIPRKGSVDNLFYVETPFWTIDTIFYTEIFTHKAIPKYVYYWLQKEHLEQYNIAGGIPSLTQPMLNKIKIPLPSLDEQQRIVDILDCFDILCNDSNIGISAEIEARQQQYEYYRDRLLSFNKI